jgi:outer membrane protein OmpA-like peptidoglycan-associated protein
VNDEWLDRLCVTALFGSFALIQPAVAQWVQRAEKDIPRTADGKLNVTAPTPRLSNGKPDLTGLWSVPDQITHVYGHNIGKDLNGGPPVQPWVRKLLEQREKRQLIDDPSSRCLPTGLVGLELYSPFRINILPDRAIVLFEQTTTYWQIFLDGRPLPEDPQPTYMGYSVAHWEGDTLAVETVGFNGKSWIDAPGHPITQRLHLTERFSRPSFGHLEITITFDDPLAYTKPWTVTIPFEYLPDSELTEAYCEDNKFTEQAKQAGLELFDVVPQEPPASDTDGGKAAEADVSRRQNNLEDLLKGLPTKKTGRGIMLTFGDGPFGCGQATMKPTAEGTLVKVADVLKSTASRRATIEGYTDDRESDDLSAKRAESVRDALIRLGVPPSRIATVGMGSKSPVASNSKASGRQQNRRVEIVFNQ